MGELWQGGSVPKCHQTNVLTRPTQIQILCKKKISRLSSAWLFFFLITSFMVKMSHSKETMTPDCDSSFTREKKKKSKWSAALQAVNSWLVLTESNCHVTNKTEIQSINTFRASWASQRIGLIRGSSNDSHLSWLSFFSAGSRSAP